MPRGLTSKPRASDLATDFESLVQAHPPQAIRDNVAYENAMEYVDALTCLPKLSAGQSDYLDTLSILIEAYEEETESWTDSKKLTPIAALKALLEENDMSASDLGRLLGERSLGSKILTGQRELSKANIRALADHFGVSTDLFL